jgi:6-phosphogluconolactonase
MRPPRSLHYCSLRSLIAAAALAAAAGCGKSSEDGAASRPLVYVGSEGDITWYSVDASKGTLERKGSLSFGLTAAFLARSADNKHLYALLRTIDETKPPLQGFVASFAIDQSTGALEEIGRTESLGDRPTYVTNDRTGKWLLIVNNLGHLHGNSIVVFPIKSDGSAGAAKQMLTMTGEIRAHQIRVHPSNRWVYVPNIDSDNIAQFRFDAETGALTPNDPPAVSVAPVPLPTEPRPPAGPGMPAMGYTGPRHLDFHPNGKWLYLSNEYAATVMAFKVNDDGTLTRFQEISGLPADYTGRKWQSEIRVAPSGKFVYAGERSHESIATFAVDQKDGMLSLKGHTPTKGSTPRNFALSPDGKWMVVGNQGLPMVPGSLITFAIDAERGTLTPAFGPMSQPTPYAHLFVLLP